MTEWDLHTKSLMGPPLIGGGSLQLDINNNLEAGRLLRDSTLWTYPILPGAVMVYTALSSTREWMVSSNTKASADRVIDTLNEAVSYDPYTGQQNYGFIQYSQRRALDWVTIGRTATLYSKSTNTLEYLDPAYLHFQRNVKGTTEITPVLPTEEVWNYYNFRKLKAGEVFLTHPVPIGSNSFVSPLAYVLPNAHLAWLLREHDATSLDGRKIRDIIFVSNPALMEGVESALVKQAALWSGETVQKVGIPIVHLNNHAGVPISDMIHTMGLSKIPENLNRAQFTDNYVNEIAAALGLSLRHFWNNEKTTNRALEEVQEQRQQQKGPSAFVKAEQDRLNASIVKQIGGRHARFSFVEESDAASRVADAQVLMQTATALEKIKVVFGASISLESYLQWMQSARYLPVDLRIESVPEGAPVLETSEGLGTSSTPPEFIREGSPEASSVAEKSVGMEPGDVIVGSNGDVLYLKRRYFPVAKVSKSLELEDEEMLTNRLLEEFVLAPEKFEAVQEILNRKLLGQILTATDLLALYKLED